MIYPQFRRSYDFMKNMKDTLTNQLTTPEKITLATLAKASYANYGGFSVIVADQDELVAAGSTPYPRTIDEEWQDWCDVLHNAGLGIIFRPALGHMEGLFNLQHWVGSNRYPAGSYAALFPSDGTPIYDDFERSSIGSNYTTAADGGSGNDWTIDGHQLTGPAADGWRRSILTVSSYQDVRVVGKIKKIGHQQLTVRSNTNNSHGYGLQLRDNELRFEDPGFSNLGSISKTLNENSWYWVKIEVVGSSIKGKAWEADDLSFPNSTDGSENEPGTWDLTFTDSSYSSGQIGFSGEDGFGKFDKLTITSLGGTPDFNNHMGIVYNWIIDHAECFNDQGDNPDVFAFYPERTENIFNDDTAFLPNTGAGIQANYVDFFHQLNLVAAKAFADIGKPNIIIGDCANNYSEPRSGWLLQDFFDFMMRIVVDYYGDYNGDGFDAQQFVDDLLYLYNNRGGYRICWQEYGPLETQNDPEASRAASLSILCDKMYDQLIETGKMEEMNFWVWWSDQNTSFLNKSGSGANSVYTLNLMGEVAKAFYKRIADQIYADAHPAIHSSPYSHKSKPIKKKL